MLVELEKLTDTLQIFLQFLKCHLAPSKRSTVQLLQVALNLKKKKKKYRKETRRDYSTLKLLNLPTAATQAFCLFF